MGKTVGIEPGTTQHDQPHTLNGHKSEKEDKSEKSEKEDSAEFPLHTLPEAVQQFVNDCHAYLGHNKEFIAGSILAAVSGAVGRSHTIKILPGWVEACILWLCLIGRPGSGKTPATKAALHPIYQSDAKAYEKYKNERKGYQDWLSSSKEEKKQGTMREPPVFEKTICSDTTLEGLVNVLQQNNKGVLQHIDEFAGWVGNFNRYTAGSDAEQYLSAWSGGPIVKDRATKDPLFLTETFVSIIGGTQLGVVESVFMGKVDNGFIDRVLVIQPEKLPAKKLDIQNVQLDIFRKYNEGIKKLLSLKLVKKEGEEEEKPVCLHFTKEAEDEFIKFYNDLHVRIAAEENERIQSLLSKMDMYCARFALIIQMLRYAFENAEKTAVDIVSVKAAINLTAYFEKQSRKLRKHLFESSPVEKLDKKKQNFYESLSEKFNTADAVKKGKECEYSESFVKKFLNDKTFFFKVEHGVYERLY